MKLLPNWKEILLRAWSARLIVLAVLLSAAEAALPFVPQLTMIPAGLFALLTVLVAAGALAARIVVQKNIAGEK